jgi:FKBP-type peptidyl-prolyl cis-trans isomerase FklB
MITNKWIGFLPASVLILSLLTVPGVAETPQYLGRSAQASTLHDIQLSFKRDPRMVDPFRGIGEWIIGTSYTGATAQDSVVARATGVDVAGKPVKISAQWSTSDPEMVTISAQGDDVKITVRKEGESTLKVSYRGWSKDLVIKAKYVNKLMFFNIAPVASPRPNGPVAEMNPALKGHKEQLSYAAGMRLAQTLRAQSQDVDPDLVAKAMKDVLNGGPTLMSDDQQQMALMGVETELNVSAAAVEKKKIANKNKEEASQFLADNSKKEGIVTLPSGLQYKVIKAGSGKRPTGLDVAVCQYKGGLIDGTVFDDSRQSKGGGPVRFPVKAVIKGWQEALKLMPEGSTWQIFVPPDLAYGERGVPPKIPSNAALMFDVELLSVKGPGDPAAPDPETQKAKLTPEQLDAVKKMVEGRDRELEKPEKNQ